MIIFNAFSYYMLKYYKCCLVFCWLSLLEIILIILLISMRNVLIVLLISLRNIPTSLGWTAMMSLFSCVYYLN